MLATDDPNSKAGVYGQALDAGAKPFFVARSNSSEDDLARFCPDGRWVSYVDDTSGRSEVYARRFSVEPNAAIQISSTGGHWPRWSHDGRQLYFRTNDWKLMAVSVMGTDALQVGKPSSLFQLPSESEYEVGNDGRFLVSALKGRLNSPVTVLINWQPEKKVSP